ncbi:acyl-CoA dehydrogenase family protein [Streptomyces arenae]|uniref:acyl-CoA dehydrogenase family protein n=1 Tax=Streptomyces arenae TaxID=29301 RepID=UPI0026593A5A|nr:acyl-CoA dehydrogenase family protein [Streptomyces arenae]MCG7207400.1 acyl-CoA dehydrogenase family protein [Streptomyces arenae]
MDRAVFTQDHEGFRVRVAGFVADEIVPEYLDWEHAGRPSRRFWRRAGELGILGIGAPVEYGGMAGSTFTYSVVVTEEIQKRFLALGGLRVQTDICMPYFLHYANDEQKRRWLPQIVSGRAVTALALSEPGAGSDLKALSTRAVREGDHYVVNGAKTFISNGSAADLVILAVKTAPESGRHGISLLVVETDSPGFHRGRSLDKLGLKAQDLAELSFTDLRVPAENLLGEENRGFEYLTSNLAQERLSIAVNSQAAASAALAHTVETLSGAGLGQHAKFELAACAAEVRAGQALVDRALAELEAGLLTGADAALAKLYCTEMQGRVVDRCLQLHGKAGYGRDKHMGRAYVDGRVSRIYGGSSEIMKVIVAQSLGL